MRHHVDSEEKAAPVQLCKMLLAFLTLREGLGQS